MGQLDLNNVCDSENPIKALVPYKDVSSRYAFLPTYPLIEVLEDSGFEVRSATAALPRKQNKKGFQTHIVRLQHPDLPRLEPQTQPEIVIVNAHDRSKPLMALLGAYTFLCCNEAVCGTTYGGVVFRHIGDVNQDNILEGIQELVDSVPRAQLAIAQAKTIELTFDEKQGFFEYCLANSRKAAPKRKLYTPEVRLNALDAIGHIEQRSDNLWNVYNRTQQLLTNSTDAGFRRLKNIPKLVKVNRFLWDVMEEAIDMRSSGDKVSFEKKIQVPVVQ